MAAMLQCRADLRQKQSTHASLSTLIEKRDECNQIAVGDRRSHPDPTVARQPSIVQDTLQFDQNASIALREGRPSDAVVAYKHIHDNSALITSYVLQNTGAEQSVDIRSSPSEIERVQYANLIGIDLIKAERSIGIYYEAMGQDAEAATWYENANSLRGATGGLDGISSVRLGFMYA